jgi:hypothetical protein
VWGLVQSLWNDDAETQWYAGDHAAYQSALLEQYKVYVEMADRVSQRRGLANSFFLTLNTAIFTLIGVLLPHRPHGTTWLIFPLIAVLGECFAWYYTVRSYRLLNGAKYRVIGSLEERLPASPYWRAEWEQLGQGKDWRLYWPLSHVESLVPLLFVGTYLATYIALIVH